MHSSLTWNAAALERILTSSQDIFITDCNMMSTPEISSVTNIGIGCSVPTLKGASCKYDLSTCWVYNAIPLIYLCTFLLGFVLNMF